MRGECTSDKRRWRRRRLMLDSELPQFVYGPCSCLSLGSAIEDLATRPVVPRYPLYIAHKITTMRAAAFLAGRPSKLGHTGKC